MESWHTFARSAAERFGAGAFDEVRLIASAGLELHPDCGDLFELRGVARHANGDFSGALVDLETATMLVPLGSQGQLALADCYARLGKTDLSNVILQFLAEPGRCPLPLLPDVARGLGRVGQYSAALAICERITERAPDYHAAWFGAAFYMLKLDVPLPAAAHALERAFLLAPESLTYRMNLARMWMETGRGFDAYHLIRNLPPDAVNCSCMARDLARIAEHSANDRLAAKLLLRAADLESAKNR